MKKEEADLLTKKIISCIIEVHKTLGPGLLESTYSECLAYEFAERKLGFEKEKILPVFYKGKKIDCGYRIDFLVENEIILELKAVEKILPIHQAQIMAYLKLADKRLGLLINLNKILVKDGIKRIINGYFE